MELIERDGNLAVLHARLRQAASGEGHCVLITGEAGIGKSSLVRVFGQQLPAGGKLYLGLCDALFTPRPLAPVYDVAGQMEGGLWQDAIDHADRSLLYSQFYEDLAQRRKVTVIAFEDIHWADEATLDFIKFLVRRIARVRCLFLLTFRDNEVNSRHPLRVVLGQAPPDSVTRMPLAPLSRPAVEELAARKGWRGEDVYAISDGIPFYVREILAAYSPGIPENIRDSILSVYERQPAATQAVWDILSVMPSGCEPGLLEKLQPAYAASIADPPDAGILVLRGDRLFFHHELYRRTIEGQLSPLARMRLNKRVLELSLPFFESHGEWERILHHAEQAQERELIVRYAPIAAKQAAAVGAHTEAARLWHMAITWYRGGDRQVLAEYYEGYSYECYLTHRIREAISFRQKALALRRELKDGVETGDCLRWLSRLWWYDGNRQEAERFARLAIEELEKQPVSRAKAMAFSNMSQLNMLAYQTEECIYWGEQAIAMARELADDEILSHALNNVGDVRMAIPASRREGQEQLEESLRLALRHSYHEHAARAYTNLGSMAFQINDLALADKMLEEGIRYCEERDLDSWTAYMSAFKARLRLRTGKWDEARQIAEGILANADHSAIVRFIALVVMATLRMRRGEPEVSPLLAEARAIAFTAGELQRIIPLMVALLEYEWIMGERYADDREIERTVEMIGTMGTLHDSSEFAFWLRLARGRMLSLEDMFMGWRVDGPVNAGQAADFWGGMGCDYYRALMLFSQGEAGQREALGLVREMGAVAVYRRMSMILRAAGVKNLPRGARESTKSNVALLTGREIDVLRLLKEGMKNKEIAAKLFISPKTVDHHISALLLKLDVESRAKAVNEAMRRGILEK